MSNFIPKIGSLVVITNSELYYCKKDTIGIIFDIGGDDYEIKMVFGSWLDCADHKWWFKEQDFVEFEYNHHHRLLEQGEFIYSEVNYLTRQAEREKRINSIRQKLSGVKK